MSENNHVAIVGPEKKLPLTWYQMIIGAVFGGVVIGAGCGTFEGWWADGLAGTLTWNVLEQAVRGVIFVVVSTGVCAWTLGRPERAILAGCAPCVGLALVHHFSVLGTVASGVVIGVGTAATFRITGVVRFDSEAKSKVGGSVHEASRASPGLWDQELDG